MRYNRSDLIAETKRGKRYKYIFFWGHTPAADGQIGPSCLSQWWSCRFAVDGVEYSCAEQYMMARKALLFGDTTVYEEIMKAKHPKQFKELGRKIAGFSDQVWDAHKYEIVLAGSCAKFSQNEPLKSFLLNTGSRILAEASPCDRVWGIGLSADDEKIENPLFWRGENLLGFALEARDLLA